MTVKEILLQEIETLPEERQSNVLAFVRFLKIGLADSRPTDQQFTDALARARANAAERGITEQDIDAKIRTVQGGQ